MVVQNMEIGNLLFGHSRGEYRLDRYSAEADRLGNVLYELGLNSYGYQDSDLDRVVDHNPHLQVTWLKEHPEGNDLRRVDVVDPNTGEILMIVRKYWWGDYDTPEDKASADAPNLEVPKLDLQMDWYKYYGRDSYTNQPLTGELLDSILEVLRPALDEAAKWLPHYKESAYEVEWIESPSMEDYESTGNGSLEAIVYRNDKALHEADEDRPYDCYIKDGRWQAIVKHNSWSQTVCNFDSREDAEEWAERYFRANWVNPDGTVTDNRS